MTDDEAIESLFKQPFTFDRERCSHPDYALVAGPRVSARWGTFPTQVCRCGAWRVFVPDCKPGNWRRDSIEAAMKPDDEI